MSVLVSMSVLVLVSAHSLVVWARARRLSYPQHYADEHRDAVLGRQLGSGDAGVHDRAHAAGDVAYAWMTSDGAKRARCESRCVVCVCLASRTARALYATAATVEPAVEPAALSLVLRHLRRCVWLCSAQCWSPLAVPVSARTASDDGWRW